MMTLSNQKAATEASLTQNKPCHQINSYPFTKNQNYKIENKRTQILQKNMSTTITSSIPYIKIPSSNTTSSLSSSSKPSIVTLTIRSSQTDGPIRRPVASPSPSLRQPLKPSSPPSSPPPSGPSPVPQKPITPVSTSTAGGGSSNVITLEFQRQMAKELQDYYKKKKLEEANQGPFFGFLPKNEISNGRWAMFGFSVGLLTEYATGSDFVDQVKILLSNFGIVDLE